MFMFCMYDSDVMSKVLTKWYILCVDVSLLMRNCCVEMCIMYPVLFSVGLATRDPSQYEDVVLPAEQFPL